MRESKKTKSSKFQSRDEAFEYLVLQSQNKALKEQWKKELDQLPDTPKGEDVKGKSIHFRRTAIVAVSVFILIGTFFWFTRPGDSLQLMSSTMIEETNFVLPFDSETRGLNDSDEDERTPDLQQEISKALEQQDYKTSAELYMIMERQGQLSASDKFYYALSLTRRGDGDDYKAIRLLEDVVLNNDVFYNEALWLQSLLFIKVNKLKDSKIILNKLIKNSNYQNANAKTLLRRMANIDG